MKKKNASILPLLIGAAVVIAALAFLVFGGEPGGSAVARYSSAALFARETDYDFGTIKMDGGNVTKKFELKNDGLEPVVIKKVYTSCMCTTANIIDSDGKKHGTYGMQGHGGPSRANIQVDSGQSVTVEAIFDPAAHGPSGVGLAERSIYIETNSQKSPKVELKFRALVTR